MSQLFISSMTKMRTVPQLVSAPLNPKSCYSKSSQCSLWQPNSPRQPSRKRLEPSASFALKVLVGSHFPAKKKTGYGPEVPAGLQKTRKPNGTHPLNSPEQGIMPDVNQNQSRSIKRNKSNKASKPKVFIIGYYC